MKQFLILLLLPLGLSAQMTFTYSYDEAGRLVSVQSDDGGSVEFELDGKGNLLNITSSASSRASLWPGSPGDKKAGIGWINDDDYPYIWHYSISRFLWIADEFSTLDSMWGYDLQEGFWFWANDAWAGWHFNANDPSYGVGGWATWNP